MQKHVGVSWRFKAIAIALQMSSSLIVVGLDNRIVHEYSLWCGRIGGVAVKGRFITIGEEGVRRNYNPSQNAC